LGKENPTGIPKKIFAFNTRICKIRLKSEFIKIMEIRKRFRDYYLNTKNGILFFFKCWGIIPTPPDVYSNVDADIYCVFGNGDLAAEVALFCKKNGKKFVLFLASDIDISNRIKRYSFSIDKYGSNSHLCFYAIQHADLIVCQTEFQKNRLNELFHKTGFQISNPISLLHFEDIPHIRKYALWVGKSDNTKQPYLLLELARAYPHTQFCLIMNPSNQIIHHDIITNLPQNVELIEYVPYQIIEKYFANSFIFINTSKFEGFPNTFLQAGKYGVPILSYNVDPDNFIENYKCGVVAHGNLKQLISGFEDIKDRNWLEYSQNIKNYVITHHNVEEQVNKLISEISSNSEIWVP